MALPRPLVGANTHREISTTIDIAHLHRPAGFKHQRTRLAISPTYPDSRLLGNSRASVLQQIRKRRLVTGVASIQKASTRTRRRGRSSDKAFRTQKTPPGM
jgi:hypothetical protein